MTTGLPLRILILLVFVSVCGCSRQNAQEAEIDTLKTRLKQQEEALSNLTARSVRSGQDPEKYTSSEIPKTIPVRGTIYYRTPSGQALSTGALPVYLCSPYDAHQILAYSAHLTADSPRKAYTALVRLGHADPKTAASWLSLIDDLAKGNSVGSVGHETEPRQQDKTNPRGEYAFESVWAHGVDLLGITPGSHYVYASLSTTELACFWLEPVEVTQGATVTLDLDNTNAKLIYGD
jgi:hypothetical protein